MAPARKSRSVNKRFSDYVEISPEKDVETLRKSRQRKRKLSGMLGSQWSKGELERFYDAYRKYGKDWKKVAAIVRNRSIDMVEALYNMNRAYLSLPEGTASVVGLIAMMTDHYNVMEGSDSDGGSNDVLRLSRKPRKTGTGKGRPNASGDLLHSHSTASVDGCLSLLKRRRSDGRAVGKRTPRFPVSHTLRKDNRENSFPPNKRGRVVDDDIARVAALALAEASQRGDFPQISQSPYRTGLAKSPLRLQSDVAGTEVRHHKMDEDSLICRSRRAEHGDYIKHASSQEDIEGVSTAEVVCKGKKISGRKERVGMVRINHCDDGREECSGTEEGVNVGCAMGKVDNEAAYGNNESSFFHDESLALNALHTLADLSLRMPASTVECGSYIQLEEEKPVLDSGDRSSRLEAVSTSHRRDKTKVLGIRKKVFNTFSEDEPSTCGKSKLSRDSTLDFSAPFEGNDQPQSTDIPWKRKRKPSFKALAEEEEKAVNKLKKRSSQIFVPPKSGKLVKSLECSSSNSDQKKTETDSAVSTAQDSAASEVSLPTKQRSRRKKDPKRLLIQKDETLPDIISKNQDALSCCLSSFMLLRWCTFEWFYSAIDYPWFAKKEFVEYLNHVGLGHIPRLTRVEWGVIRSSLGKPRRFSEHFLCEEREKLKQYRESVRKHYAELRAGIGDGLPTDLARPLSVGQRVIAIHPKSREVHDGHVLTVDHDRCRIQFDRPELGVEFVMDIDCMPSNPFDNIPEALRRLFAVDRSGQANFGRSIVFNSSKHLENSRNPINDLMNPKKESAYSQPGIVGYAHAREADVRALAELSHSLNKKEAMLMELNPTNDDLTRNQHDGDFFLTDTERFRKQYATQLPPYLKSSSIAGALGYSLNDIQELGSDVVEIVKDSRSKAHTMVDAAIQAFSSLKEGEDVFARLGDALDSLVTRSTPVYGSAILRSSEQVNGSMDIVHPLASRTEPMLTVNGNCSAPHCESDRTEAQVPAALITSCVATLLMIQTCTERHCPPADVAQMLDCAVTSLHPAYPQNMPIYREIEMCMGRIKTQLLALVPT